MLHLLGSLIGRRLKVQRVDETDRNPITPGVTQFHWNRIDHNQHDSWWSLAPTATKKKKCWLFSMVFHNLLHTYCQSGIYDSLIRLLIALNKLSFPGPKSVNNRG